MLKKFKSKKKAWSSKKKKIVAFLSLALGIAVITPFYITAKAETWCYYSNSAQHVGMLVKCTDSSKQTVKKDNFDLYYVEGPFTEDSQTYKNYKGVESNTNTTETTIGQEIDNELLKALYGNDEWESHKDEIPSFDLFNPIDSGAACIGWAIFKLIYKTGSVGSGFFNFDMSSLTWAGFVPIPNFTNGVMKGFVYLLSWIAQIMLAIGILLSIGEETIRYGNGQGNFASTVMNVIKAIGFTIVFIIFGCTMYQVANNLGMEGALLIMKGNNSTLFDASSAGSNITATGFLLGAGCAITALGSGGLMMFTVAILFVILWIKTLFFYMKKVPQMVAMLGKGSVLPFFLARGQTQAVTSYLQQLGMFYLQIVLQFAFIAFGMNIMGGGASGTEGTLVSVALGTVMILSIDEIDKWVGGLSGEDDLNKAVSFMHHANMPNFTNSLYGGFKSAGNSLKSAMSVGKVGSVGDSV